MGIEKGRKHCRLVFETGFVAAAATPSDHRNLLNVRALSAACIAKKEPTMIETMTAEERREAFSETFADSHDWDYAQWLHELTQEALEHIEGLMGAELAAGPLRQLIQPVADIGYPNAETWRDVMDDVSAFFGVLPIASRFSDALLYGLYGVTPEEIVVENRAEWLNTLVTEIAGFAARSDVQKLGNGDNALLGIADLSASRHAIDIGQGEVDAHSMAILGGITEGRVRNLLSGAGSALERGQNGGVVAMSAASWLQKKKGFLASIWREEKRPSDGPDTGTTILSEKMIFVPVARDGSMFTPDLMRNDAYRIGAKGEEEGIPGFAEALERLNAMAVPRWRRPNEKGLWGIVSGVAWQRIEKK